MNLLSEQISVQDIKVVDCRLLLYLPWNFYFELQNLINKMKISFGRIKIWLLLFSI